MIFSTEGQIHLKADMGQEQKKEDLRIDLIDHLTAYAVSLWLYARDTLVKSLDSLMFFCHRLDGVDEIACGPFWIIGVFVLDSLRGLFDDLGAVLVFKVD